jgi:predicted dehydrogenase
MNIWLVGAGAMAQDYCKVLLSLNFPFEVIGRSEKSAKEFEIKTGKTVRLGGLQKSLRESKPPNFVIVAVGAESLAEVAMQLIRAGSRRILLEKPGGLNIKQIRSVSDIANKYNANVLIAYNRRFYASIEKMRNLIKKDEGPLSCNFEFTEWSHIIAPLNLDKRIKKAWFLLNSSHVVDLVFHLCGFPKEWKSWQGGMLDWHPSAARFCGAGITEKNVFFSYLADWEAPGRWSVEVLTRKHRFILRPMEQLQVMRLGSVKIESVLINDELDKLYKPGLFKQTKAFLDCDDHLFCSISEHLKHFFVYDKMANYG